MHALRESIHFGLDISVVYGALAHFEPKKGDKIHNEFWTISSLHVQFSVENSPNISNIYIIHKKNWHIFHWVKNVGIPSYLYVYFPAFAMNMERYFLLSVFWVNAEKFGPGNYKYGQSLRTIRMEVLGHFPRKLW